MASDPIKRQDKDFHSGINDEMTPAGKGKETTEKGKW